MTEKTRKVFCYGASGHGKVVADILALSGAELLGFVDDDATKAGAQLAGVPVMETPTALPDLLAAGAAAVVTIGSNQARTAKARELEQLGFKLASAIHPSAVVARDVAVGGGTVIMAGAIVNSGSRIGASVIVNTAATVDHDCVLADGAHISPGANLAGGVVVGGNTHVGIRASVIQGIRIGAGSIVGAGAVVIRDVPPGVTVVGNPARILNAKNGMSSYKRSVFVSPDRSIRETLQAIDGSGLAIALVVDERRHLLGTVTDGDARRAILQGVNIALPVTTIMNGAPLTVTPAQDIEQIRELLLTSALKHVPVVDNQNRVLDLITVAELLSVPMPVPDIPGREIQAVTEILGSSSRGSGSKRADFEQKIAGCANRRFAVAVNSGSSGLHLLVRALGLGPGDEVITSPFGFIASAHCLLHEGAIPTFVDIDPRTYHLDQDKIEAAITPRTKAILAVDAFGQPANYDGIQEIATRHGLCLMIDACESIGAEYQRRRASSCGVAAAFSFSADSQITTGEGGAIVTDDRKIAELCRSMRDQGSDTVGEEVGYERLGYNYRLAEFNSALGLAQLERIDEILECRQRAAERYDCLLEGWAALDRPYLAPETTRMSWFAYTVCLSEEFSRADRDQVIARLRNNGIGVPSCWSAIHLQPLYRQRFGFRPRMFPVTEAAADRTLALPVHNLQHSGVARVVEQLRSALESVSQRKQNAKAGN
ncbi:MAG TPA: NeuD/PglB/VioB family sugar acetyltransferase [Terriglobales bacterium]|nr:NeuD/PglB/VioB family sugar acetyltransferase [Terriglobales bacterium]